MVNLTTQSIQQAIDTGIQHHLAGSWSEAKGVYNQILQADPNQPTAIFLLGMIELELGSYDTALVLFEKAIVLRPDYAEAHCNLGTAYVRLKKPDAAIISYRNAIAVQPDYAEAHCNLGATYFALQKLDEAAASYLNATEIAPEHVDAHYSLGVVLTKQSRLEEAAVCYRKAITIKPDYVDAHFNLGNVLKDLGELEDAVSSYHHALNIRPDYAKVWNNLKFAVKALHFASSGADRKAKVSADSLCTEARASVGFSLQQFFLDGFYPHKVDESFENVIKTLPPKAEQAIVISEVGNDDPTVRLQGNIVALVRFGRSGTGLLHNLIDGHPEISTLPGVYLRGYFNQGVWDKISANGWRALPERFSDEFAVLFDANSPAPIPSRIGEKSTFVGHSEGMTMVGENRDETLSLNREAFCDAAMTLIEGMESIDPMSFLMIVHAAYDEIIEARGSSDTKKHLCFYHLHNPDDYAMSNFLRYAPTARMLVPVREPIVSCESALRVGFTAGNYEKCAHHILGMLFCIDQIAFRKRESVGIRHEDIKARPDDTIKALCAWLGVEDSPTLYETTVQGKKWWGDPSSPDYDDNRAMSAFGESPTKRPVGEILSETDQFVLATLFYPFSVRFGYRKENSEQFQKDLREVRPMLDDMLDLEKTLSDRSNHDHRCFRKSATYQLFHSGLIDRWDVLSKFGEYPFMLKPLLIA